jgi:hypothetical protein
MIQVELYYLLFVDYQILYVLKDYPKQQTQTQMDATFHTRNMVLKYHV